MANLSRIEKRRLERELDMGGGYVLEFSNRTFENFILDSCGLEIYDTRYEYNGESKANRMRTFWDLEPDFTVAKMLEALVDDWSVYTKFGSPPPSEGFLKIIQKLKQSASISDIDVIQPNSKNKGFESLARAVRESIEKNEPEAGLDRLHTYLVKYFRTCCQNYGISVERDKPLHSLVGEYIKAVKKEGLIESDITERILKSTISVMEAFNKIRNDHSFAHDNEILNYNESLLIFGHVTNSIKFIETIETKRQREIAEKDEEFPF